MPNKKATNPVEPVDTELENRVDEMMDTRRSIRPKPIPAPTPESTPASTPAAVVAPPPIDIFQDALTAPEVSPELLEQIGVAVPDSAPAPPSNSEPAIAVTPATDVAFDDFGIDEAVDDIVASESDALLAAEDASGVVTLTPAVVSSSFTSSHRKRWLWLSLVVVLLIAVFVWPFTRYRVLGLVLQQPVIITVTDSTTKTPVSSAQVSLAGVTVTTDGHGRASFRAGVGQHQAVITKQYYTTASRLVMIGLRSTKAPAIHLVATGRQVPITITNKITGQPLAGAEIKVLNTSAKTDGHGRAIIVLPTTASRDSGTVALPGYNEVSVSVAVTGVVVPGNSFALTPSGSVYFLSNEHGTIDVVKANLDGSNRKTVLAGTGKEDPNNTQLLASRDWRYLVLKAQRDGPQAALYLIDGVTDKTSEFDSGNANFNLIGWYGHGFVYDVTKNNVATSQNGHELVKSYDAERDQLNQLDQTQASGDTTNYAYQGFYNFILLDNLVVYTTQWYQNGTVDLSAKTDTIRGITPSGQGKKDYQSFAAVGTGYLQASLQSPSSIDYARYDYNDTKTTYYRFEHQSVASATDIDQTTFSKPYPTYLVSPSGDQTLWSELRDGKSTVFTGDADAKQPKPVGGLSGYAAYGWYSDSYALVNKDNSELFVVATSGAQPPLKITDYYKSAQKLVGYGYGYGGL